MTQTDKTSQETPKPKPAKAGKGRAFFQRAEEVAETGNWDFAIEMYVEGLKREPDNIEQGHRPLREVALKRKAQRGKGPGLREQLKFRPGKDPVTNVANAAYLLAKEPGSISYMQQLLKASQKAQLPILSKWICDILLESQRQAKKPNMNVLFTLIQSYHDLEEFALAIQACEIARGQEPNNPRLHDAMSELSAKYTIKKGKYDQEGDFTRSVSDLDGQQRLMRKDALVKDRAFLEQQIVQTRQEYEETPSIPGKINAVVDALCQIEEETYENEAIDVLKKAFSDSGAYQFKMRIGDIRIRQLTRRYRQLVAAGDKAAATRHAQEQLLFELAEYTDRVTNYPTDLALKYELGRRQFLAGQYDEAIASLQVAQRDPRRRIAALTYLGQAFIHKDWLREAADTFERALESQMTEDRAKEIRYLLGDVLERMGQTERAQDCFSEVAQMDYNYRDVRDRLEMIRKKLDGAHKAEG